MRILNDVVAISTGVLIMHTLCTLGERDLIKVDSNVQRINWVLQNYL
jgi:hypothetical protein